MTQSFQRRPRTTRSAGVLLSAFIVATGVSGCGGDDVEVRATKVSGEDAAACRALVGALPETVADQARRKASGNDFAAAWGDPAIVLRCGVGTPHGYDKFAACQRAAGVDWFVPDSVMADQHADVVMTTVGRSPRVEITVPAEYRPSVAPMTDVAEAIKQATREISPCL